MTTENYIAASVSLQVPFQDIDPAGVAWHGHYFRYLEPARVALMETLGYSYKEMVESGYYWPIVDAKLSYRRPLKLHQKFQVSAQLREWEYRLKIRYRLTDLEGEVLTRAETIQAPQKADSGELVIGCPAVFTDKVKAMMASI